MRLTMKAGKSSDTEMVLPRISMKLLAAPKVSSSVAMTRISFTSCILGTGFMMWMLIFFFKQKTAYEITEGDWSQTCALPIFVPVPHRLLRANGVARLRVAVDQPRQ